MESNNKPTVLFVCTHNAGRSALGAALARHRAGERATVLSAGMAPASKPSHVTIASLAEIGIDDSTHKPTPLTHDMVAASNVVVAMKPGLALPQVDGPTYETWDLPNPADWDVDGIRPLRDHIDGLVTELLGRVLTK